MASGGDRYKDLPATWPFRTAGTLFILAMVWFCAGFALKDSPSEGAHLNTLPAHMDVFRLLILAGVVFIIGGAIFNIQRERRRKRTL